MSKEINFQEDITALEDELATAQQELEELEERWRVYDLKTQETREALESLRRALRGELPEDTGQDSDLGPVDVNAETGRPPRGARREQIEQICRKIGRGGKDFRTAEVLSVLEDIEGDLTDGMRSYTYAVMSTLQEEGVVTKVGRGRWELA